MREVIPSCLTTTNGRGLEIWTWGDGSLSLQPTASGSGTAAVIKTVELIAWLRKTYPEHFDETPKHSSIGTLSAKLELDTGDLVAETAQIAEALERAAAALARLKGER